MLVLGVQTAMQPYSIALIEDGAVLALDQRHADHTFSEELMSFISQLCESVGRSLSDIGKVVVVEGPGSYTGLRIGVTTASMFGLADDIPVQGVSYLEAQVWPHRHFSGLVFSVMPARRDEWNVQLFGINDGVISPVSDLYSQSKDAFDRKLETFEEPVTVLGFDGVVGADTVALMGETSGKDGVAITYSHAPVLGGPSAS